MSSRLVLSSLLLALVASLIASLLIGSVSIAPGEVIRALAGGADVVTTTIVLDIRLPRTLLAAIVGGGLACAGAAIQGLFRNPLADPALIGVSSGAALFAAGFIIFGGTTPVVAAIGIPGAAFVGGLLTTLLVLEIGRRGGTISSILLAGIAINAIALAGVGLMTYLSTDLQLRSVAFWALGSFNGSNWQGVLVSLFIPVAVTFLVLESTRLNAITLGDDVAGHLGIRVESLRFRVIALTALAVGVGVALAGVIAFVGLVVPHLIRLTAGSNHHTVLPCSALLGAILVVLADCLARALLAPAELPIGILTALLGGPFFIYLIIQQKGKLGL
jgi:iron complex transport system permease protein